MGTTEQIATLVDDVVRKIGNPMSDRVVLATLESLGIRNKDVLHDYGAPDLKFLSLIVYAEIKKRDPKDLKNSAELEGLKKSDKLIPVSSYLWMKALLLVQNYPLGLFHLAPVVLQVVTIILFGYSLWTYTGFNIVQSTAVVLGVILGFVVSGGYVQVLGRQASFYWHHGEMAKTKKVIDALIVSGIKGMLFAFLILGITNLVLNLYPFLFVVVSFTYAFLIGLLLLILAPFYTLRMRWVISLAILIGSMLALGLKFYTDLHVYITHWIGIFFALLVAKLFLSHYFRKYRDAAKKSNRLPTAKLVVMYKNYGYFFYGILIYIFIFLDRILAWSTNGLSTRGFILLYEKNYEIGMDLAILVFFLLIGVLEYAITSFSKLMDIKQKQVRFVDRRMFNVGFLKMYKEHIAILFVTAVLASVFLFVVINKPWGYERSFGASLSALNVKICIIGGVGYFFLAWGMLNALYMFTLGQHKIALRAILVACAVNFSVGYICSRVWSYEYSVIGMVTGAFVFMLLTTRGVVKFYKTLDYQYYAAY